MIEIIRCAKTIKNTAQKKILEKISVDKGFEQKTSPKGKKGGKRCQRQ